ncbi:MAG: TonB-dependent receptor [Bryobacterales bacterium]|nr:TonB-dependent receptor [Bryobacterales bacterium]
MSRLRSVLVLLVISAAALHAQGLGRISGLVMDQTGAPVPDAAIQVSLTGANEALYETRSSSAGIFNLAGIRGGLYDVKVEKGGFRVSVTRRVKVDGGLETALQAISLELSSVAETVEVVANSAAVQTANVEIASTVTNSQLTRLPTANRSPLGLLTTQPGIGSNSRTNTAINGLRPSYSNITIDGVNIQDNFIRTNTNDFLPNLLLLDQVEEVTLVTSNANPALGGGASQIAFTTKSGTNEFHGKAIWQNRNNALASNTWFNNRNNVRQPFLNQNQMGGSLGGPIMKNKLFFYTNYEAFRLRQQSTANRTIFREDARNGIFKYRDNAGNILSTNFRNVASTPLNAFFTQLMSQIPDASRINRNDIGDTLNTGGYSFLIRNNRTRDNFTIKGDYSLSTKHNISVTHLWNRDILDRPDLANDYSLIPKVSNDNATRLWSATWRWSPSANFTNEARGGFNVAPAVFGTSEQFPNAIIGVPFVSNPLNTFRAQGRYTDTYNYQNNSSYFRGKHNLQFGFQGQRINVQSFNDAGNIPTYGIGLSAANSLNIDAALPGVRAQDRAGAYAYATLFTGYLASVAQTFNVTSTTSGFVPGAATRRNFRLDNLAFYLNDTYKIRRNLTLAMGLRWDYFAPVDELDALVLLPQLIDGNPIRTLLSSEGTLDFAGKKVGRPWYKKDLNNFAPNIGLTWQPMAKTSVRAGVSFHYANDEFIRSVDNSVGTNAGLVLGSSRVDLVDRLPNLPSLATPTYRVPRTFRDNYLLNPAGNALAMPDPGLVTPYVTQWNLSVQREMWKGVLQVAYVGNKATKQFRAFDYNQVIIGGLLDDFRRALGNGNASAAAGLGFNPAFNANVAGSQRLPFIEALPGGGNLNNANVRLLIETGQVGSLAEFYQVNRINGNVNFFQNINALGTNMMTNYSNANYHSLQIDFSRRYSNGIQLQSNYVLSKNISDAAGDAQARFEPFLDINNGSIERSVTPFDLRHSWKTNGFYDLPFGRGQRFFGDANSALNYVLGGWSIGGIFTLNSGSPFGYFSGRGTLNSGRRSGLNTVSNLVDGQQLRDAVQFRMTGNGPVMVAASAVGSDGRGVGADNRPAFQGQLVANPGVNQLGTLNRRFFYGPRFLNFDFVATKNVSITERHRVELRMEALNSTNTPSFFAGDDNPNSQTFGRITGTASGRRVVQLALTYSF